VGTVAHSAATINATQQAVNAGKPAALYNTNPMQVLYANLPRYGFVKRFRLGEPVKVVITRGGRLYDIYVEQLVKRTSDGAWFIVETARHVLRPGATPVPQPTATPAPGPHPVLGVIHHTAADTVNIQKAIDAGNRADLFYLNPVKVMDHNLGQRGFKTPVQIQLPLKVLVNYGGRQYDVFLNQPAQKGENGVWVISSIGPHHA
jgi:hypothetical protein